MNDNTINNNTIYETSIIDNWDNFDISPSLLRGIHAYGFERPSPIQQQAIKPLIDRQDVIAQAQSGTGKTATFTIGALQRVNVADLNTQVLILSPTRELATQTANVITNIGSCMTGLKVKTLFGGTQYEEGSSFSNKNVPHIICGCPGRIYDMMRKGKISCKYIKLIIIDEADEMLSTGFKDQMYNIFQYLNNDIQVGLFSATMPDEIQYIIDKIMRNPVKISVKREQLTLEGIKQFYIAVDDDRSKYDTLKQIFEHVSLSHTIIYCNSVKRVQDLYEAMCEEGFPVCRIYGEMDKTARAQSINEFKNGTARVMISSNVTARGIDIQQVSVVINFDVSKCVHTYLHRIGRSGRWGRKGIGINFVTRNDIKYMQNIESHYGTQIEEMPADMGFLSKI